MGNSNSAINDELDPVQALLQTPDFLPVGYGFRPTDAELIGYLSRKTTNSLTRIDEFLIPELEVYKHGPSELPIKSPFPPESNAWYFFSPKDRMYPGSRRQNRANEQGNWNVTGKDQPITDPLGSPAEIGKRRTLVFYLRSGRGRGDRTVWIIYEYATTNEDDAYVLCRLIKKPEETLAVSRRRARNEGETSSPFPAEISNGAAGSELPAIDVPTGGIGNGNFVASYGVEEEEEEEEALNQQGASYFSPAAQPMPNDTELADECSSLALWKEFDENEATLEGILDQPIPTNAEETSRAVLNSPLTGEVYGWPTDDPFAESDWPNW